jgi:ketosteroid isomerase-like protein
METDRAFSRLSVEKGTAEAFYRFIDDSGTALPRQGQPVTKQQYARFRREQASPRRSVLRWEPDAADVAESGDLGWTRGRYELLRFEGGDTTRYTGHYITVWKRQKDGTWKFVLDAGNIS